MVDLGFGRDLNSEDANPCRQSFGFIPRQALVVFEDSSPLFKGSASVFAIVGVNMLFFAFALLAT